jgi:hypothetical protein
MELDASMLRPIVGQALDASVAVPVEWSVVPILAGAGQGLGVFRVLGSARIGGAPREWSVILKVLPGILGVADQMELSGARGARLRTRTARGPAARGGGVAVLWSHGARQPASAMA